MTRHISYTEYVLALAEELARKHRPAWSVRRARRVCACGSPLPCRVRQRVLVNRGRW
ncbi:hypothetical protein [Micromonospora sp. NBS 11-29]|uniref:hypothetical protein n=1 Tax=Micromonospora sp. NBS 11-29 TaxID=1960879 RepID=UPI001593F71D|nr:hypothetical protein [Micromonospora sp. NBS 11-29]